MGFSQARAADVFRTFKRLEDEYRACSGLASGRFIAFHVKCLSLKSRLRPLSTAVLRPYGQTANVPICPSGKYRAAIDVITLFCKCFPGDVGESPENQAA